MSFDMDELRNVFNIILIIKNKIVFYGQIPTYYRD